MGQVGETVLHVYSGKKTQKLETFLAYAPVASSYNTSMVCPEG